MKQLAQSMKLLHNNIQNLTIILYDNYLGHNI